MSDDPRRQPVVIDHGIELEALATLRVEVFTISINGLRQALQENRPEIIVTPPAWWPRALCALFALYALTIVAYQGIITFKGLTNVVLPRDSRKGSEALQLSQTHQAEVTPNRAA